MAFETTAASVAFLVARVAFGGVLAFMGLNHFLDVDAMAGYAEMKGLPAPRLSVLGSGGLLVLGGLGIVLGVFPVLAAGALAVFLVASAVLMHDFWAVPEDQKQDEMTGFLKNVGLFAGAVVFLALGTQSWAFALNLGLF